ncbi:hypothetical protein GUJ93_ZPchr0006g45871 [Zizania palustris]|uniref:Uncharacterized protein n=1 Tax=Zizania palustris TaxID=103762 RepID=A0A8J5TFM1_ZIZPA|nr:hypothetical protein GUJ93_ZPchr0006g45871 [Zizania palustris]
MSIPPETCLNRHRGGFVRVLRILVRVLGLEDDPSFEGYFPRVGGIADEHCEVVVTIFGHENVLLFHSASASATGFETACEEAALQMLAELRFMFDARLHTSAYCHLSSCKPGSRRSVYMGTSSASDPVGGQDLFLLTTMDYLHYTTLHRVEERDVVI